MKRLSKVLLVLLLLLSLIGCNTKKEEPKSLTLKIKEIAKHGNLLLDTTVDDFNKYFIAGDIVDVKVNDQTFTMPVGTSYSDVDSGNMIIRMDKDDDEVIIAINMGDFSKTANVSDNNIEVIISMNTKAGYIDEYTIRSLEMDEERDKYLNLSDEQYANFRVIDVGNIKDNILYRSTSPIDDDLNRNEYVDKALKEHNIKVMFNLADSNEELLKYEGYNNTYYSTCNIYCFSLDYDFTLAKQKEGFATMLRLIISEEGPYLIHCKEGKDRTGITIALIEMLLSASLEEIKNDYMETYINLYRLEKNTETYNLVLNNTLLKTFKTLFNVEDLNKCNLKEEAIKYTISCGLTEIEINNLINKLSK